MTYAVTNRQNLSTTIHFTASNSCIVVGNSTTSNVATGNEVIQKGYISHIHYGTANTTGSNIVVRRGANSVLTLCGSGFMDFAGSGDQIMVDSTATVNVAITGTGFAIVKIQKVCANTGDAYFQN